MWFVKSGRMGQSFYDEYIKDEVSDKEAFEKGFKKDDLIDYYRLDFKSKKDGYYTYSSLWLFNIYGSGNYVPVFLYDFSHKV